MERSLRGKAAVAGVGQTTYYKHGQSPHAESRLTLEAILNAIDQDPSGWGFAISPAVGYSYTSRKGVGILVQVSERFIIEREGVLGFPTLNVGFRYFL